MQMVINLLTVGVSTSVAQFGVIELVNVFVVALSLAHFHFQVLFSWCQLAGWMCMRTRVSSWVAPQL